ncbi:MAG TPA: dihydrodipicolinate synthase family protein [Flavitalea sp.]|nr:dihydrodipicolinate synthase family protein [Flavitalea sp.]
MQKEFVPVMLTPFKENGLIDFDGLTALTEHYLQSGAKGLFANCLSSEMFDLTASERLQVVQQVIKATNGSVPVVATGTFDRDLKSQAEFIKRIADTGVKAVIVISSIIADENEKDAIFNQRIYDLLKLTDNISLGFYECPVPYKRLISPEQLKLFIETERVTYHKDTSLDIGQVRAKISAGAGHHFGLYDAYIVNAVESLKAGAAGLSCIQGNYFPELVVWLCNNFNKPDLADDVQKVQDFFSNNMNVMHDVYPFSAKYCLQKQGLGI